MRKAIMRLEGLEDHVIEALKGMSHKTITELNRSGWCSVSTLRTVLYDLVDRKVVYARTRFKATGKAGRPATEYCLSRKEF